jgi:hypothetical protein
MVGAPRFHDETRSIDIVTDVIIVWKGADVRSV